MTSIQQPTFFQMIRAPFLSSIISPLFAGTLVAVNVQNGFSLLGFLFVMIMGIALHVATNVYNDIYDTIQGTDRTNAHRNEFSGGSGVLVTNQDLFPKMYAIARISLIVALIATIALMFVVKAQLYPLLWSLYLLSAFFAKYYTAAPFKLAYRGLGEISVWFAFGPMAIAVAAVSQNLGLHPSVLLALPTTGLSTLSILMVGQMIDVEADGDNGKWGAAVRLGNKSAAFIYLGVQSLLIINILVIPIFSNELSYFVYLALIPYVIFFPKLIIQVIKHHDSPEELKSAAKTNVLIHLLFFLLFSVGLLI